jgi:hypothetical protein
LHFRDLGFWHGSSGDSDRSISLRGEFIRIGHSLDYVGGDEALSDIERDKLSLQEVKGCLKDHMPVVKDAM